MVQAIIRTASVPTDWVLNRGYLKRNEVWERCRPISLVVIAARSSSSGGRLCRRTRPSSQPVQSARGACRRGMVPIGFSINLLTRESEGESVTRRAFWAGFMGLYLAGIWVALLKLWQQFGGQLPISNVWQIFALALLPLIWGILPVALAVVWLAMKRFDLSKAKVGLLTLGAIYLVLIYFQWQSPRPI